MTLESRHAVRRARPRRRRSARTDRRSAAASRPACDRRRRPSSRLVATRLRRCSLPRGRHLRRFPATGAGPGPNVAVVRTVCPRNCYCTCGMVVTLEDGRITRIDGDPHNTATRGHVCLKGISYARRVTHRRPPAASAEAAAGRIVRAGLVGRRADGHRRAAGRGAPRRTARSRSCTTRRRAATARSAAWRWRSGTSSAGAR